jgi:hypothetical protein
VFGPRIKHLSDKIDLQSVVTGLGKYILDPVEHRTDAPASMAAKGVQVCSTVNAVLYIWMILLEPIRNNILDVGYI